MIKRAIELKPGYAPAYGSRGLLYWREGDIELARRNIEKALELDPDGKVGRIAGKHLEMLDAGELPPGAAQVQDDGAEGDDAW